jgi:hypothetical protein
MGEELTARHELKKQVDVLGSLGSCFKINLDNYLDTIKGWLTVFKILYSLIIWSTCWAFITYYFFMILAQ